MAPLRAAQRRLAVLASRRWRYRGHHHRHLGGLALLARMGRFRGFSLYIGMLSAPLVIPEVVIGISLLLMFVEVRTTLGWPENGIFTIWVGHTTFCMAFVAVIIQSRVRDLDRSLEEAALTWAPRR